MVTNAIDSHKFYVNPFRTFEKELTLICVARLVKIKAIDTLIKTLYLLKQKNIVFKLHLVGTGDDELSLKQLTKELNLENQVQFIGYVDRENIPQQYDKAHIFVLFSYKEGMSNAMLEAMSAGLPILVSNTSGAEELLERKIGFSFEAGNIEEAANFLEKMYLDRDLLKKMSENARKVAEKNSWENIAAQYEQIFLEITKK